MKNIILALSILILSTQAYCASISLVGADNMSQPTSTGASYTSKSGFGGGALLEGGVFPMFGLEIGALYLPRKYSPTGSSSVTTQKMLEVPLVLRAHLGHFLSIGLGGYYSSYSGDVQYDNKGVKTTSGYPAANLSKSDYGLVSSLGIYIPIAMMTRFIIDARYTMGLKDNDSPVVGGRTFKFNDIQVLAGLRFGF